MHRVSLGGRYGRPRGKRLREASRYRRNATLFDYGVTQDRTTMNTLRRLCGTMPPTHVSHPPTSFMSMWFSRTSDLRISAAKSPFRHRLHILKHVRVCPREHACGIRPGARQAHVFNYARGHLRKYVWAHVLASFSVQLLHRNGAFSCDFRQVLGRRR